MVALDRLRLMPQYREFVDEERSLVASIYEATFDHQTFTGRSGTFFGYEGLGSIYWHMVSKLSLAVMEYCLDSVSSPVAEHHSENTGFAKADSGIHEQLCRHFRQIRDGLGLIKTPNDYGAFPFDPYSHTPGDSGVQQPGMTGQVKEDILTRWYELGIRIRDGQLWFDPSLFESVEWIREAATFEFFDSQLNWRSEKISKDSFAFTLCQVPIVYHAADRTRLVIHRTDEESIERDCLALTSDESQSVFNRSNQLLMIEVYFPTTQA
jgi:hypothetical protein